MSALEDAQLLPQCQVLGEEPSRGTKAAQDQTQPEAEHGQCSYQIGACGRTDNLLISWTDRILANHREFSNVRAPLTPLRSVKLHRLGRHQEHAVPLLFARMCNFEQSCHEVQAVPSKYVEGVAFC